MKDKEYYKDVYSDDQILIINPDEETSLKTEENWFKNIVFYHIWIKSFYDSNGDGIGDIRGIIQKFDYIKSLGVKGIWLSPFFQCSYKGENMHGYDVIDYYSTNELFGTKDDLKELLILAHSNNIKVIFDYPLNHTSINHPWFKDASNNGKFRDFYIWNDNPGKGWNRIWEEERSKTTWHPLNNTNYYGIFHKLLPDLNFTNIEVRNEMAKILIYWLDFGFDGVRIDGARYIFEDGPHKTSDTERTHRLFQYYQEYILNKYSKKGYKKILIAEAWGNSEVIKSYYGIFENGVCKKKEFDMCFNFPLAELIPQLINKKNYEDFEKNLTYQLNNYPDKYLGGIFLTNHDLAGERPATEFKKDENKMLMAFYIQLFLPGTPFIYYGNEIGMENDDSKKLLWDMRVRGFMQWNNINKKILYNYKFFINIYNKLFSNFEDKDFIVYELNKDKFIFKRVGKDFDVIVLLNLSNKNLNFKITKEIIDKKMEITDILNYNKLYITENSEYEILCSPYSINIFKIK